MGNASLGGEVVRPKSHSEKIALVFILLTTRHEHLPLPDRLSRAILFIRKFFFLLIRCQILLIPKPISDLPESEQIGRNGAIDMILLGSGGIKNFTESTS